MDFGTFTKQKTLPRYTRQKGENFFWEPPAWARDFGFTNRRLGSNVDEASLAGARFNVMLEAARADRMRPAEVERKETLRRSRARVDIEAAMKRARQRAQRQCVKFDLEVEALLSIAQSQGFRCAATGIDFDLDKPAASKRRPWAISIDRILAGGDYVESNVRLVVTMFNIALSDWGEEEFRKLCAAYVSANLMKR